MLVDNEQDLGNTVSHHNHAQNGSIDESLIENASPAPTDSGHPSSDAPRYCYNR
jgi:hypothetical protein